MGIPLWDPADDHFRFLKISHNLSCCYLCLELTPVVRFTVPGSASVGVSQDIRLDISLPSTATSIDVIFSTGWVLLTDRKEQGLKLGTIFWMKSLPGESSLSLRLTGSPSYLFWFPYLGSTWQTPIFVYSVTDSGITASTPQFLSNSGTDFSVVGVFVERSYAIWSSLLPQCRSAPNLLAMFNEKKGPELPSMTPQNVQGYYDPAVQTILQNVVCHVEFSLLIPPRSLSLLQTQYLKFLLRKPVSLMSCWRQWILIHPNSTPLLWVMEFSPRWFHSYFLSLFYSLAANWHSC